MKLVINVYDRGRRVAQLETNRYHSVAEIAARVNQQCAVRPGELTWDFAVEGAGK